MKQKNEMHRKLFFLFFCFTIVKSSALNARITRFCLLTQCRAIDLLGNSICGYKNGRVITMQSQRTFIAAISAIMLRLRIFLEIMKALNEEMTIFKLIGVRRALDKKIDLDQFLAIFP